MLAFVTIRKRTSKNQFLFLNKIKWKQIFEDMDSSEEKITQTLKVNIFPTYIIVKKTGEIIYQGNGDELFSYINNFKTILKNEQ